MLLLIVFELMYALQILQRMQTGCCCGSIIDYCVGKKMSELLLLNLDGLYPGFAAARAALQLAAEPN